MLHAPGTFCWLELATTDSAAARPFYAAVLGLHCTDTPPDDSGHPYIMLHTAAGELGGLYELTPQLLEQNTLPHWLPYLSVADADETAARARQLGGTVALGPFDVRNHGRMAVLKDPGGAVLAIWQAKSHGGFAATTAQGSLCWAEVNTRHFDDCVPFYSTLFDWDLQPMEGLPARYMTFLHRGQPVAGALEMTGTWAGIAPNWMVYFAVDDAEAAMQAVKGHGGQVCVPPFDTPYGRIAVAADPQGAYFSVCRLATATAAA